ncbi:5-formyltetrahydrofolate cyclo-ligase [Richelia intracellularis]|uniref:5-formyltetrahydrofolate cyclo-ligase n=1 Tax=Richelia intracellularis TaxID=1164990 RepID=UPI0005C7D0E7|nr:5-formyltetrahydrofolate cyclo-ligase [Richelia intracellularis]HAE05907.1 5-formyltetrahydrofolate cyclo-ligase [Richelia sp.]
MDKYKLRRKLIMHRESMLFSQWQQNNNCIIKHIQSLSLFIHARTVLAYFSFRQEPDLSPLFTDNSYIWGFPRCVGRSLYWHKVISLDPVKVGMYGILEPNENSPRINLEEVDLILVPSVACDHQGYRLGYGGGYYDYFLSSPLVRNTPTIGIIFEFAYIEKLPIQPWDIKLSGICTEIGIQMI